MHSCWMLHHSERSLARPPSAVLRCSFFLDVCFQFVQWAGCLSAIFRRFLLVQIFQFEDVQKRFWMSNQLFFWGENYMGKPKFLAPICSFPTRGFPPSQPRGATGWLGNWAPPAKPSQPSQPSQPPASFNPNVPGPSAGMMDAGAAGALVKTW